MRADDDDQPGCTENVVWPGPVSSPTNARRSRISGSRSSARSESSGIGGGTPRRWCSP
ncbi:hypothetical protein L6R52_18365 [Myxococcota bacterium]|nr:hypothetical protein [Myxococcota bacterium]